MPQGYVAEGLDLGPAFDPEDGTDHRYQYVVADSPVSIMPTLDYYGYEHEDAITGRGGGRQRRRTRRSCVWAADVGSDASRRITASQPRTHQYNPAAESLPQSLLLTQTVPQQPPHAARPPLRYRAKRRAPAHAQRRPPQHTPPRTHTYARARTHTLSCTPSLSCCCTPWLPFLALTLNAPLTPPPPWRVPPGFVAEFAAQPFNTAGWGGFPLDVTATIEKDKTTTCLQAEASTSIVHSVAPFGNRHITQV